MGDDTKRFRFRLVGVGGISNKESMFHESGGNNHIKRIQLKK
ncbi:uncharacterized protein G2W53_038027 [Senna tora]|uniref:Uncharacterized protein n=1 Tax=Senna tora TaxID=362788 RepID=A0A834W4U0_9FABA|nr:uncharacterized protein G2W53_038027 [Senna tora]